MGREEPPPLPVSHTPDQVLTRIRAAMAAAEQALKPYVPGSVAVEHKGPNDPVTVADRAVDAALRHSLLREGEGWLSEELVDDLSRLRYQSLWIVDPIDGTQEFIRGIPEWGVSVAWVVEGHAMAGGVYNPQAGRMVLGSIASGTSLNDTPVKVAAKSLLGATVLASRSEVTLGAWNQFGSAPFAYRPMGSIAYKLALVSCGLADATFTLVPKNEWDVAGGAALVEAAGGLVTGLDGKPLMFNQRNTLFRGLVAGSPGIVEELLAYLRRFLP